MRERNRRETADLITYFWQVIWRIYPQPFWEETKTTGDMKSKLRFLSGIKILACGGHGILSKVWVVDILNKNFDFKKCKNLKTNGKINLSLAQEGKSSMECVNPIFSSWYTQKLGVAGYCDTSLKARQIRLTYFVRGSIDVQLTSLLTGSNLTKKVNLFSF